METRKYLSHREKQLEGLIQHTSEWMGIFLCSQHTMNVKIEEI